MPRGVAARRQVRVVPERGRVPPRLPVGSVQTLALQLTGACTPWHTAAGDVSVVAAAPAPAATPASSPPPTPPAAAPVAAGERPPAELVVGTRPWRLTAFALHGLQSDACAEAKAARGTAACAVLGGARLRVRSVATHVLPSHVRFGVGGGSLLSHEAEAEVVAADADGGAYQHHASRSCCSSSSTPPTTSSSSTPRCASCPRRAAWAAPPAARWTARSTRR